jgi:hypothetical protein
MSQVALTIEINQTVGGTCAALDVIRNKMLTFALLKAGGH